MNIDESLAIIFKMNNITEQESIALTTLIDEYNLLSKEVARMAVETFKREKELATLHSKIETFSIITDILKKELNHSYDNNNEEEI